MDWKIAVRTAFCPKMTYKMYKQHFFTHQVSKTGGDVSICQVRAVLVRLDENSLNE